MGGWVSCVFMAIYGGLLSKKVVGLCKYLSMRPVSPGGSKRGGGDGFCYRAMCLAIWGKQNRRL